MKEIKIILSRHKPTIDFLQKKYPSAKVIEHLRMLCPVASETAGNREYEIVGEPSHFVFEEHPQRIEGVHFIGNAPLPMIATILKNGGKFTLVSIDANRGERGGDIQNVANRIKLQRVKSLELEAEK